MSNENHPYVLVLDNGKEFSTLLAKALRDFNLIVYRATDIYTAKRKIAKLKPEVIFFWEGFYSDKECFSFCEGLKKVSILSDIPYIIVTAVLTDSSKELAQECKADAIIPSSMEEDSLRKKVTSFISGNN